MDERVQEAFDLMFRNIRGELELTQHCVDTENPLGTLCGIGNLCDSLEGLMESVKATWPSLVAAGDAFPVLRLLSSAAFETEFAKRYPSVINELRRF